MNSQPADPDGHASSSDPRVVAGVEQQGDALVLVIVGEVDAFTVPQVVGAVDDALARQPRVLVADLTQVTFFSSAGLAALVDAHRKAGEDVRFRIVATGSATLRPLELTGLTDQLAVFTSREEALAG